MNNELRGTANHRSPLFNIGLYIFLSLCPIFFLANWDLNMIQGIFFCFGTFALLGLSFLCPKQREYRNPYLGIFILYSLINVFIHTFNYGLSNTYARSFLNYCLMSEGFIYVLCGCILFYLIVSYSNRFKLYYPIFIINILNIVFCFIQRSPYDLIWLNNGTCFGMVGTQSNLAVFSAISIPILWHYKKYLIIIPIVCLYLAHSFTGIVSLFLALIIYCIIKKKYLWLLGIIPTLYILYIQNSILWVKIWTRLFINKLTLIEIIKHPFIGWGFDNSLMMNKVVSPLGVENTFVYRNNDYLNIARDLGLLFLIFLCIFLFKIFKNAKKDYLFLSALILVFACGMQTSFYFCRIAVIGIFLVSLMEIQNA